MIYSCVQNCLGIILLCIFLTMRGECVDQAFDSIIEKNTLNNRTAFIQIGIKYIGQDAELNGCDNDLKNLFKQTIESKFNMASNPYNLNNSTFFVLTDETKHPCYRDYVSEFLDQKIQNHPSITNDLDSYYSVKRKQLFVNLDQNLNDNKITDDMHLLVGQPTRINIERVIKYVMEQKQFNKVVLQYSGHGSQQAASKNSLESDGMDEVLVPVDYQNSGCINDNWFHSVLTQNYPGKTVLCLLDCCHSESILDLSYELTHKKKELSCFHTRPDSSFGFNIISLSGCKDSQTSADTKINNMPQGALTWAFIETLKEKEFEEGINFPLDYFARTVCEKLHTQYEQIPQMMMGFCLQKLCYSNADEEIKHMCSIPNLCGKNCESFVAIRINQTFSPIWPFIPPAISNLKSDYSRSH